MWKRRPRQAPVSANAAQWYGWLKGRNSCHNGRSAGAAGSTNKGLAPTRCCRAISGGRSPYPGRSTRRCRAAARRRNRSTRTGTRTAGPAAPRLRAPTGSRLGSVHVAALGRTERTTACTRRGRSDHRQRTVRSSLRAGSGDHAGHASRMSPAGCSSHRSTCSHCAYRRPDAVSPHRRTVCDVAQATRGSLVLFGQSRVCPPEGRTPGGVVQPRAAPLAERRGRPVASSSMNWWAIGRSRLSVLASRRAHDAGSTETVAGLQIGRPRSLVSKGSRPSASPTAHSGDR